MQWTNTVAIECAFEERNSNECSSLIFRRVHTPNKHHQTVLQSRLHPPRLRRHKPRSDARTHASQEELVAAAPAGLTTGDHECCACVVFCSRVGNLYDEWLAECASWKAMHEDAPRRLPVGGSPVSIPAVPLSSTATAAATATVVAAAAMLGSTLQCSILS